MSRNLLSPREVYRPFEYQEADKFAELQHNAHWLPSEVAMAKDLQDWNEKLTESERNVLGQILKSFTQTEVHVNDYWARVPTWFPKPEIKDMASAFANMEAIHTKGYAYLNDSLGLGDYAAFLSDPTAVAKLDRLKSLPQWNDLDDGDEQALYDFKKTLARSLAIFSAFTEGVNLFSSFAILMNFSRFDLLAGVETIVSWSIRDESLHSLAGCWLFRTLVNENPDIWDEELKDQIKEAARLTVKLEDEFIDHAFSLGQIRGLTAGDLKQFIRQRTNTKLSDLGLYPLYKNLDKDALNRMKWFDDASGGTAFTDFFAKRVTDYFKSDFNLDNMFDDGKTEGVPAVELTEEEILEQIAELESAVVDYAVELQNLKDAGEAPAWMTPDGYQTISKGYRLKGETPKRMYQRVALSAADHLGKFGMVSVNKDVSVMQGSASPDRKGIHVDNVANKFFDLMWKGWMCPASPVLANMGTDKGLPISCYGEDIDDSMKAIAEGWTELTSLSSGGGGVGIGMDRIRPRGSLIKGGRNGSSEGIIPFIKVYDSAVLAVSQGSTRRGAASINLSIDHGDWGEFIRMRRPEGDINRQCGNLHHCTVLDDAFLDKVEAGDREARKKWVELMKARIETGESYIMNRDVVNRMNPQAYKDRGLEVTMTNICSEIVLHTDPEHSFVCCLSSANLYLYEEWKDEDLGFWMTLFLNGVLNEFLAKGFGRYAFDKVLRSAAKGRPIGIGVLGWHSLLQSRMVPFESFQAMQLNAEVFKNLKESAEKGSRELAELYGEPEWCVGTGMFNTHLLANAPTRSNATIAGVDSFSTEPNIANIYSDKGAKGVFYKRNREFEKVLDAHGKNNEKIWDSIRENHGSVQHLAFLTDLEREVFKTAYEISQYAIIKQAEQRQKWVCQAQSINLFFPQDVDPVYFSQVHLEGARKLKTLYYCRSRSGIKADVASRKEDCVSCEG
jgi:ribonucleoside-diphosphate reductase alpha chain